MDATNYKLDDALKIHGFFRAYRSHGIGGWWFRGHADSSWPLISKAGRPDHFLPQTQATEDFQRDLGRFKSWRERAIAYLEKLPENDWECLAVAQHHGLATRLLDWSLNPMVAVFFACCERLESDGCVYCYDPPMFVDSEKLPLDADVSGVGYVPRALSPRILNQRGAFTVHGPPTKQIIPEPHSFLEDTTTLVRLDIPKSLKWELLIHLDAYGINRATLFPDIDGLCAHVNFETQEILNTHKKYRKDDGA